VLYLIENIDLASCSKFFCKKSRFIPRSTVFSTKVLWFFPFIARLLRMYCSLTIIELLQFHTENSNTDETIMESIVDSPARKHVNSNIYRQFGNVLQNLRLDLSLDGVNPFPQANATHSTWPFLHLIQNLPPYLVINFFLIQLCLLILKKITPTSNNIGVLTRPLLDELQRLWIGVSAQDFSKPAGVRRFKLKGILMWTALDYLALELISSLTTHDYHACVACGLETKSKSA
jgi:hypothetical protein